MRKGLFLKVIHDRFSHDMLTRYKKKKSLRGLIESKKELVELMQVSSDHIFTHNSIYNLIFTKHLFGFNLVL